MTIAQLPPTFEPIVDDDKKATLTWSIFFEALAVGDAGTVWTPTFTGLTETGTATKTGIYYRLSKKLVYYRITITPATDTSAVAGTTYCNNFPLTFTNNSANLTVSSFSASAAGTESSTNRIYTAAWTAITTPITIVGIAEIQ